MIGAALSHYRITAKLGAGGMGEVYRATDTRLGREVAIKVLPAAFAADPDRLARFDREAKLLASLNHPNVAQVYGFENVALDDGSGVHFLAMELVPGEELAEHLARGPLPVDEALAIAKQIVAALEAAHERGIVHRDLKPANIKLTPDGTVKVLDFGLAKAYVGEVVPASAAELSQSPTLARHGTQIGMILGTAAYMSPEQARGKPVDKRADVWAFAVVLFEMLRGKSLFGCESVPETLAAVLTREPPWDELPPGVPPSVRDSLRRCFQRDPRQRLRDIGDFRWDAEAGVPILTREPRANPWRAWALTLGGAALGVVAGINMHTTRSPPAARLSRLSVLLPDRHPFLVDTYPGRSIAIAPGGTKLAYVGRDVSAANARRIFVRSLDDLESRPVAGTDDAYQPFFSPAGDWLAFFTTPERALRKVSLSGGPPIALVRGLTSPLWSHGSWSDAGFIVHDTWAGSLGIVPEAGGTPRQLKTSEGETYYFPQPLPGTDTILYTIGTNKGFRIETSTTAGERRRTLVEDASYGMYLASGHLLFTRDETLLIAPFDARVPQVTGPAVPLPLQVKVDNRNQGAPMPQLAVSRTGTLAYVPTTGALDRESTLTWLTGKGTLERIGTIPAGTPDLRLSPDGTRLAIARRVGKVVRYEVLRLDGLTSTLVADVTASYPAVPVWHTDGRRILVTLTTAAGDELWSYDADGAGTPVRLVALPGMSYSSPQCWSRDGRFLTITAYGANSADVLVADLSPNSKGGPSVRTFVGTVAFEGLGCFSPDGRLIAYTSEESGRPEVYVRRFPGGEDVTRVSREGGSFPRWSPRGDAIYFTSTAAGRTVSPALMASRVERVGELRFAAPRVLHEREAFSGLAQGTSFDVAPDGRLLIRELPEDPNVAREIVIVQNWFDEVHRLTGSR